VATGLVGAVLAAMPAQASPGDSGREHGCASHWRNTANWNECKDAPGVNIQLQVDCEQQGHQVPVDYYSDWKYVQGSKDPVQRYECVWKTNRAWNAFRF
jgi:hypothetical protein